MSGSQKPFNYPEQRRQLIAACRNPKLRTHEWTKEVPTEWNPSDVTNPVSGLAFTEMSAWEFVATLLEGGWPLEEEILNSPPGKKAYKTIVPLQKKNLYLKLMPWKGGGVYGRSFHHPYL